MTRSSHFEIKDLKLTNVHLGIGKNVVLAQENAKDLIQNREIISKNENPISNKKVKEIIKEEKIKKEK